MFDLSGKRALVTGSTQGIGKAIAKTLAEHGAEVITHCSADLDKANRVAKEIGAAFGVVYNLEDSAPEKLYEQTGDVDILVLNASVQVRKKWDEINGNEYERQMKINVKSNFVLMQMYGYHMQQKKWGRILTIGSVQQYKPHKDMLVYAATKAAIMNIVQNLAKQLAPEGITVNNLAPGVIATPRNADALADSEYNAKVMSSIPMGYAGNPEDCIGAALLLCSDEGRYITGIDLVVDGGMKL